MEYLNTSTKMEAILIRLGNADIAATSDVLRKLDGETIIEFCWIYKGTEETAKLGDFECPLRRLRDREE